MINYQNDLTGKKVLVMGLGRNNGGAGSTIFAIQSGASEILCTDLKDEEFNKPATDKINSFIKENNLNIEIRYILGEHREKDFLDTDIVIKNPGVRYTNKYIQCALDNGKTIESEISLFLKQKNPESTIISITGSKGKSSTSYLIYHLLENTFGKKEVKIGGNMGISLFEILDINFKGIYVIETSSFATEEIDRKQIPIDFFLITSLYPDHLNYYDSLDEYYESKLCVIDYVKPNNVFINDSNSDLHKYTEYKDVQRVNCLDFSNIHFPHNFNDLLKQNAVLACTFLNKCFGLTYESMSKSLETYTPPEGRFQYIGNIKTVDFINDTCASIPEAAIFAINTLKEKNKKIFEITGGSGKNVPLDNFYKELNDKCEKIYLIKGGNLYEEFVSNLDKQKLVECTSLEDAMIKGFNDAKSTVNSTLILSRGCTSFGVANNEFEMGQEFNNIFEKLKNNASN